MKGLKDNEKQVRGMILLILWLVKLVNRGYGVNGCTEAERAAHGALEGPVVGELPPERRLLGVHQLTRREATRNEHTAFVDASPDGECATVR